MSHHVLYLVNDAAFFLSHRLALAEAARAAGFRVSVATGPSEATREIVAMGFEHTELPMTRSGTNPFNELRLLISIAKLFRSTRPDLVHTVTIKPVLYGGLLARLLRVPAIVAAVTGMGFLFTEQRNGPARRLAEVLYRVSLSHPNGRVILQNKDDWRNLVELRALQERQGVLIPGSGVDLDAFVPTPLPEGPPLVLFPARMLWDKGAGEFVEAARMLRARGSIARFVMVGPSDTGNPTAVGSEQLEAWQAEKNVEWWGARSDMPAIFARASLVVLPSYREGMPKVLLEATAAGRAIVTTDVPGCRDVIDSGKNGLLVPVRDAHALAGAIECLSSDRRRLEDMGRAGRQLAERSFGLEQVVASHMDVYDTLLKSAKTRRHPRNRPDQNK